MITTNLTSATPTRKPRAEAHEVPFGVNEIRLTPRQWLVALVVTAVVMTLMPRVWNRQEKLRTGPDYRIPYSLGNDYWLFGRRANQVVNQGKVILIGDSVVWGEYVAPDGTLSHFLNGQVGATDRFVNLGIDGLFPLAQEGLINYYGQSLRHERVLVQFNPLWLTSRKADLSDAKQVPLNHAGLLPQFTPRIPCYRATADDRLSAVVWRNVSFLQWVGHVENAYFDQKSIPRWTLADDGGNPPQYLNAYRNPLAEISLTVPSAPVDDPDRGPKSPRHRSWSADGQALTRFEWVNLDASLQWSAFQRLVEELRRRGNSVFVVVGPFNEHLMVEDNRAAYRKIRDDMGAWLRQNGIPHAIPEVLPSELYADASHPLTEGYHLLAKRMVADRQFREWSK